MKAHEVIEQLIEMSGVHLDPTVDTVKLGDNTGCHQKDGSVGR